MFRSDESGSVIVVCTLCLLLMLGAAALVMDLGHLYVVRREIQQAAEAGAYAGARALALIAPRPNWENGKTTATATIRENSVDGGKLSDFNTDSDLQKVQAGYWNLKWNKDSAPENLNGYLDPSSYIPSAQEVPAVKVNIAKVNGGTGSSSAVNSFFAAIWGTKFLDVKTSAVAMMTAPSSVGAGKVFPMATPEAFVQLNWEGGYTFRIYSDYHAENRGDGSTSPYGGQWTSFLVNDNSAATAKDLVNKGNPAPLKIGDLIYIQPGTMASVYKEVGNRVNQTMLLAVVTDDFHVKSNVPIKGFAAFKITGYSQGQTYIEGHFVQDFTVTGGGPGGPYYGSHLPPKMVQ